MIRNPGQHGQLLMPGRQWHGIGAVHLDAGEQSLRALRHQPAVHLPRETAKACVLAVAEPKHGVRQALQRGGLRQYPSLERTRRIRRFAIAERTDDEQGFLRIREQRRIHLRERPDVHRQASRLQLRRRAPGQLFGKTTLAGKRHQPRLPGADGRRERQA